MWEKIVEIFGINADYSAHSNPSEQRKELLDHLDLREWYDNLPSEKQRQIRESKNVVGIGGGEANLLDKKMLSSGSMTQQDFLADVVKHAAKEGDIQFAEEVLSKALSANGRHIENEHFMYNELIKAYYKERNNRDDAIEKCIEYCKSDISIVDEFLSSWDGDPPRIPSFKRLAIIYENRGKYEEATEICDKAIDRNLSDKTKGGFEGRKQRILNKMD